MNKLNMRAGEILLLFCLMILKNQHFILSNLIHHFFSHSHRHRGYRPKGHSSDSL